MAYIYIITLSQCQWVQGMYDNVDSGHIGKAGRVQVTVDILNIIPPPLVEDH